MHFCIGAFKSSGLGAARTPVFPAKCNDPQRDVEKRDSEKPRRGSAFNIPLYKQDERGTIILVEVDFNCFFSVASSFFRRVPLPGTSLPGDKAGRVQQKDQMGFCLCPGLMRSVTITTVGFPSRRASQKGVIELLFFLGSACVRGDTWSTGSMFLR